MNKKLLVEGLKYVGIVAIAVGNVICYNVGKRDGTKEGRKAIAKEIDDLYDENEEWEIRDLLKEELH